ncbi:MAG TPA: hypothetical protein VMU75_08485 [Acidimicrobiales bacterium]|nr:hypothetical protein [Acidimicrobiales bacterium]
MIVRILNEGQFEVDGATMDRLEALDAELAVALAGGDEEQFQRALAALQTKVRSIGRPVDATTIVPSDLTLPAPGSTLAEVQDLLASEEVPEGEQTTTSNK